MSLVSEKVGIVLVLLAASLWATVGVGAQLVPASARISSEILGLARTAIAGPVILLAALAVMGPSALRAARLHPGSLIIFAVSNAVFQIGLFRCFTLLGVTITVFVTVCLPPVIAMVLGWLRHREPITAGNIAALAHAIVGLGLIAGNHDFGATVLSHSQGIFIAIITSVSFVTMSDAARSLSRKSPPLLIAGAGLSLSSLVLMIVLPVVGAAGVPQLIESLADPSILGLVLYLGLVPTALAYVCYCTGIAGCRSALVALIASMIEPAVAAFLAIWILSDSPTVAEAIGCMLLMLAMVILWQSERRLARRRAPSGAAAA